MRDFKNCSKSMLALGSVVVLGGLLLPGGCPTVTEEWVEQYFNTEVNKTVAGQVDDELEAKLPGLVAEEVQPFVDRVPSGSGITEIRAGSGLAGGGTTGAVTLSLAIPDRSVVVEKLASVSPSSGKVLKSDGAGGVKWDDDLLSTSPGAGDISAVRTSQGSGLTGGGESGELSLSIVPRGVTLEMLSRTGAAEGQVIKLQNNSLVWANDLVGTGSGSSIASVTACPNGGLTGGGSFGDICLSLNQNGVQDTNIADNAVRTRHILNGAVTRAKLDASGATAGQVLKFNGSQVVWDADSTGPGTGTLQAGQGIAVSVVGNTTTVAVANGGINGAMIQDGAVGSADLSADSVGATAIASGAVGSNEVANGAVTQAKLNAAGAANGRVLTTDGTNFSWTTPSGGPWQTSSTDVYYNGAGNVGIGSTNPQSKLHVAGRAQLDELLCGSIDSGSINATGTINTTGHIYADADINGRDIDGSRNLFIDGNGKIGTQLGVGTDPITSARLTIAASSSIWGIRVNGTTSTTSAVFAGSTLTEGPIFGNGGTHLVLPTGSGTAIHVRSGSNELVRFTSSVRYKHDIKDLTAADDQVLSLRPVSFVWNSTNESDIGFVAEEVAEVLPELVNMNECGEPESVKYDRVAVYLLEVIKQQSATINEQQKRLDVLEAEMSNILARIDSLK